MGRVEAEVQRYYRESTAHEWRRLVRDAFQVRLEFETTLRYLEKYLPRRGNILDAGGGPGRYTVTLAKKGYQITLLDKSPELLALAQRAIHKEEVTHQVREIVEGDIRDLSRFGDSTFDAVL